MVSPVGPVFLCSRPADHCCAEASSASRREAGPGFADARYCSNDLARDTARGQTPGRVHFGRYRATGASQSSLAVMPPSTHVHSIFWYVNDHDSVVPWVT